MTTTEIEVRTPPAEWLQDCPRPEVEGERNRDLWAAYQARGVAIDQCNAEKRRLRQWVEDQSE